VQDALASIAVCTAILLGACAAPEQPSRQAGDAPFARSARARLSCTPMGDRMVCQ